MHSHITALVAEKRDIERGIAELRELARSKKIGFTASAFDLPHAGHMLMLEESKRHLEALCGEGETPCLIVLLQSDPSVDRKDKNRPVQTLHERFIQISANRFVDYVMIYDTEEDLLLVLHRLVGIAEVRFIGEDWKEKEYTGKGLPFSLFWNGRGHGYSTTSLRERVWKAEMEKRRLVGEGRRSYEMEHFPHLMKKVA